MVDSDLNDQETLPTDRGPYPGIHSISSHQPSTIHHQHLSMKPPAILILCTGNSCRSHLAEGILRAALTNDFRVESAGSKPAGYVHPFAVRAMAEIGIDISGHRSKHMDEFLTDEVRTVITVCGNADQVCPMFPGQMNRHH